MFEFKKQNDLAKETETRVCRYLRNNGLVVTNVADDPQYFKQGVDLIVTEPNSEYSIDVKADYQIKDTGNVFLEVISQIRINGQMRAGWLVKPIDYIYYVDTVSWLCYIYDREQLFQWAYNQKSGRYGTAQNDGYISWGILMPKESCAYKQIRV